MIITLNIMFTFWTSVYIMQYAHNIHISMIRMKLEIILKNKSLFEGLNMHLP